jgi:hypothetical protein
MTLIRRKTVVMGHPVAMGHPCGYGVPHGVLLPTICLLSMWKIVGELYYLMEWPEEYEYARDAGKRLSGIFPGLTLTELAGVRRRY